MTWSRLESPVRPRLARLKPRILETERWADTHVMFSSQFHTGSVACLNASRPYVRWFDLGEGVSLIFIPSLLLTFSFDIVQTSQGEPEMFSKEIVDAKRLCSLFGRFRSTMFGQVQNIIRSIINRNQHMLTTSAENQRQLWPSRGQNDICVGGDVSFVVVLFLCLVVCVCVY